MNNSTNIILITGSSSTGKSTLANTICLTSKTVKLNTKSLSTISSQEFSQKFFTSELEDAFKITRKKFTSLYDISLEFKKTNNNKLLKVWERIKKKHEKYGLSDFLEILYKNYAKEVKNINSHNYTCIIDNNIFLAPFPARKNIFLKNLPWPQAKFKIINLYCDLHTMLTNNFTRNERFFEFVKTQASEVHLEKKLLKQDISKGFSHNTFRQPLRTIENLALLYEVTQNHSSNILEAISTKEFLKIIKVVLFEQVKLIGFLLFRKFTFTHIIDNELIQLNKHFKYLKKVDSSKPWVFIKEKRCFYDLQIVTDHNLNQNNLHKIINKIGKVNIKNVSKNKASREFIYKKFLNVHKQEKNELPIKDKTILKENNNKIYVLKYLTINNSKIVNKLIVDILNKKQNVGVIFPVSKKHYTKIIFHNLSNNTLTMNMSYSCKNKAFDEFDNNLIFLAILYSKLKNKVKFERLYFDYKAVFKNG